MIVAWLVFGIAAFLLGGLALVLSIKGLASGAEPNITTNFGQRVGRPGLVVFLVLGAVFAIAGGGFLIAAIKAITHH
jgi:hypothetical protein